MRRNGTTGAIGPIVAFIVAAWLSGAAPAEACSCSAILPACQNVWVSDAVFVGRVVNIRNVEHDTGRGPAFLNRRRVTLEVLEQFRGGSLLAPRDGGSGVEVLTGQSSADCGTEFKPGESYLVFATATKSTPSVLQTGLCNRTRELSRAQDDLPYLRALATSSPRGGRIYGFVELADPQGVRLPPGSPPPERKRMADVPVTITDEGGPGVTKTTSTNASGEYEFTDLAPGKYRVEASLPERFYVNGTTWPFAGELRDVRGCSQVNLFAAHDGRVSGRLLDARGKPVAGLTITLLDANNVDAPYQPLSFMRVVTNGDGVYELRKVPPGRYVAAINAERDWTTRQLLQPRILHPGVESADDATRIEVGPGERVKLADGSMPPSRALVILRGTVTTADGQPAPGANVSLSMGEGFQAQQVGGQAVTDEKGQFGISALEGQRYRLKVYRQRTAPAGGAGAGSGGDPRPQKTYERATSDAFVAAADAPWFTLRLDVQDVKP